MIEMHEITAKPPLYSKLSKNNKLFVLPLVLNYARCYVTLKSRANRATSVSFLGGKGI